MSRAPNKTIIATLMTMQILMLYIESLESLSLDLPSFDVIMSNCVVSLVTDKQAVLRGAFNLLKLGDEMYFSDVFADFAVSHRFLFFVCFVSFVSFA